MIVDLASVVVGTLRCGLVVVSTVHLARVVVVSPKPVCN